MTIFYLPLRYTQPDLTLFFFQITTVIRGVKKFPRYFADKSVEPRLNELQKTVRIERQCEKFMFSYGLLNPFQLAHQTIKVLSREFDWMFWHPIDPWGRVHSENIMVFVHMYLFLLFLTGGTPLFFKYIIQNSVWSNLCWFQAYKNNLLPHLRHNF